MHDPEAKDRDPREGGTGMGEVPPRIHAGPMRLEAFMALEGLIHARQSQAGELRALLNALPRQLPPDAEKGLYDLVMAARR